MFKISAMYEREQNRPGMPMESMTDGEVGVIVWWDDREDGHMVGSLVQRVGNVKRSHEKHRFIILGRPNGHSYTSGGLNDGHRVELIKFEVEKI